MPLVQAATDTSIPEGPWTKYANDPDEQAEGPWTKYANDPDVPEAETKYAPNVGSLIMNIPGSFVDNVSNMASALSDPVGTGAAVREAGFSGIVDMFDERYGSWSKAMQTLEDDPFGFALDASVPFSAGGTLGARLPGVAGKIAAGAAKAGRAIDPILGTAKGVKSVAKGVGSVTTAVLGTSTGSGGHRAISLAFEAGKKTALSGDAAQKAGKLVGGIPADKGPGKALLRNMKPIERGGPDPFEIVYSARGAEHKIRLDKGTQYKSELKPIFADKTVVNLAPIEKALDDAMISGGMQPSNPKLRALTIDAVTGPVGQMKEIFEKFKSHRPRKQYHTMEGLDVLKKQLGGVLDKLEEGTNAHRVASNVVRDVKKSINGVNKKYTKVLSDYDMRNQAVNDLQRVFSLGDNVPADRALVALMSVTRDTAARGGAGRMLMMKSLVENGATDILYSIAGQHLQKLIKGSMFGGMALGGVATGFMTGVTGIKTALLLAAFSPKIVGWGAYSAGKIAGTIGKPLVAADKAAQFLMRKAGRRVGIPDLPGTVTKRGVGLTAAEAGRVEAPEEDPATSWYNEISARAEAKGYKIDRDVIERVSALLASENPDIYIMGIKMLGGNKRLMEIIKDIGSEADQGE